MASHEDGLVGKFFDSMARAEAVILERLNDKKPMVITQEQEREFQKSTQCHICKGSFDEDDVKVRDHNHYDVSIV